MVHGKAKFQVLWLARAVFVEFHTGNKYAVLVGSQTKDEPAEERVRLVKLGFLLTDTLVFQVSKELSQSVRLGLMMSITHDGHCFKSGFLDVV